MSCHGNGADHCCYFRGTVCPYVEENTVEGRRWACGLYRELQDWDAVIADPRYLSDVQTLWKACGYGHRTCKSWPQEDNVPNGGACCWDN